MKYRAVKTHQPDPSVRLHLRKGDTLTFERRPTTWKGWIWCTSRDGRSAWVPESWVRLGRDTCTVSRDYDSNELELQEGMHVIGDLTESGWIWARDSLGNRGWAPLDHLEPVDDAQTAS